MGVNWSRLTRFSVRVRITIVKRYLILRCCTAHGIFCIHSIFFVKSKKVFRSLFEGYCEPRLLSAIESRNWDGKTYIFKDDHFWRLNDALEETDRGYPKPISSFWGGVPNGIDEIFTWGHNRKFYFFKGNQYYRYNDQLKKVDWFYPLTISQGWPGLPSDGIDAAFTWSNGKSYFFKGSKVYLWDNINDEVEYSWRNGKPINNVWWGLPNKPDSAFRWYWDGRSYFFKYEYYYYWDDATNNAHGPYFIGQSKFKNICEV